ncbi:MAG: NAD(P)H-dependent oxidoreductase subunit E [Paracoccaceae bacterium]|uniref:NAD(P)H-dependent oxidoreductase subunit E n=1 Tax=Candidatus Salinivivens marinus TaxID=3381703 RepID=UPI000B681D73|nr:NADH-quinone oxidoreductase subunit F [Marinovum sp.]OUU13538.1 MAG: NADH-quinone oxidoreductase subunit F [Rhodobacteraceae bacterium TMED38]PDH60778.1 MAG: NADH-quinone oxidoreductase subunit F [Rhodobacteraceae bacterium MED-G08]|tara:strand:+ start:1058 stop:2734 length:1677 start_codon:yes stop_codon:yes gene_type:complete
MLDGIWKNGSGKGRKTPKGRQYDDNALKEVEEVLSNLELRSDLLIEHLHRVQDEFGHLSMRHLRALAELLKMSMAEVYEVATFYAHFDVIREDEKEPPALTIRVCDSLSCELAGSNELKVALENGLDVDQVRVLRAPCMGRCDTAPTLELGHNHIDNATIEKVQAAISSGDTNVKIPDYETLKTYLEKGGYSKLKSFEKSGNWQEVQETVLSAGLRGLGGAGFPSGKKWEFVRANSGPRYLAVNGDEGEPGTFKDRYYLERSPHLFLEGMLIAAWAVEAEKVFIYMRDEYPAVLKILRTEISALEKKKIVSPGYIDLRRGAGAYICGEESAMIESIEGKRGLPRHRPPFVAQVGIFNRPTLVHNVETLYWIARICREGPEILNSVEKNGRKGLRSYSVSGRVNNPGVHLLPAGSTIKDIIEAAGGMPEGHKFKAYQPGGPSSGILPASMDDIPLDFDTLQPHGSFIGSAAVVVLSDHDRARDAALNMLRFFEDESCGQCTPCRVGCEKAVKLMQAEVWDADLLNELGDTMVDASICGLGQAASNPIKLTIKHFPDEVS